MKRFKWPLQRLLEVTCQREKALRSEIFGLSRKIARGHQEIFQRQATVRAALSDLSHERFDRRMAKQRLFLDCSAGLHRAITQLKAKVKELEVSRGQTTEKLMKTRASREILERLREEARQQHIREQLKLEQKDLDEAAQVSFARKKIQARRSDGKGRRAG